MDDHRQQRAQEKLCVVLLRIDQHDRLGDERSDAGSFWRRAGRCAADGGREAVAQAGRRDARGRQELLIVEADDLRTTFGLQIALEIDRNVDGRDGIAGPYRPRSRREVGGALNDAEAGRRGYLLHECSGGLRPVFVDDDHPQPADHRVTEDSGQNRESEKRHAEDQYDGRAVVQQPSPFASGDEKEPGLRRRSHSRARQSR